jgi:hypothetical protein
MKMEVKPAEGKHLENWNEYVKKSQQGTIFHTMEWLKIAEKFSGGRLYPIIGLRGEEVVALYPVFFIRKKTIKTVFSPPPNMGIQYLGPAYIGIDGLKQDRVERILDEVHEGFETFIERDLRPNYSFVLTSPGAMDARHYIWRGYDTKPLFTYRVDLSGGVPGVWSHIQKNLRNDILRTEKKGIIIEDGNAGNLKALTGIIKDRYREQGIEFEVDDRMVKELYTKLSPEFMGIKVVKVDGIIAGGMIIFYHKETAVHWQGSVERGHKGLALGDMIIWNSIKTAIGKGLKTLELGGANNKAISSFKSKFHPKLDIYFLARKSDRIGKIGEYVYKVMKRRGEGK